MGVFDSFREESYPYEFAVQLRLSTIAGGVPSDKRVAEGWIKTKLGLDKDEEIQRLVAETMVERGVTQEEAAEEVSRNKNLNGFKRDDLGLYIEGRQIKSMLKEDISIAASADKIPVRGWGKTSKWIYGFFAEHVFIPETTVYLKNPDSGNYITEPSEVIQRFVKTKLGATGIQYEEVVYDCTIDFRVVTDYDFKAHDWAMVWTTGEQNGLGASRSQGYGRYEVTRWDRLRPAPDPAPEPKVVVTKGVRGRK